MPVPRVAAIHDLSCFGRCSLTVALPVLSAMGLQCCPLPTACLSTHTGGFQNFTFLDMTEELRRIVCHWQSLNLHFQAVYSGFLGSERQISIVSDFVRNFRRSDTIVLVDPVMGDHGKAYKTCTPALRAGMTQLAEQADVITPNLTEAAILLGIPYGDLPSGEAELRELAVRLSLGGRRSVVVTGVSLSSGSTGAVFYDARTEAADAVQVNRIPRDFCGTGDLFAAVLTGALTMGQSLREAVRLATEFVRACAARTAARNLPFREGVEFEPLLHLLTEQPT